MTKLFPDQPDFEFLYTQGPWWSIVHLRKLPPRGSRIGSSAPANVIDVVMQAVAVLLLKMSYEYQDFESSDPTMAEAIKKLLRWLRAMRLSDPVASRAYDVVRKILKNCAPSIQSRANELLALHEDPGPLAWANHGLKGPFDSDHLASPSFGGDMYGPSHRPDAVAGSSFERSQGVDDLPGFPDDMNAYFPTDHHIPSMTFGTPFYTNFDQGAPVMHMQDLWGNTVSGNAYDLQLAGMHISQEQRAAEEDPQKPYPSQQNEQNRFRGPQE